MEHTYKSGSLDHLGLVAGMYDKLGIGERLDELLAQDLEARNVSIGQACKALVINGLGFTQRTLYMVTSFFEGRPVEALIGPGVEAGMLNDTVLGRALDKVHEFGTTALFAQIAPGICQRLGLSGQCGHMDITSFSVEGSYNGGQPAEEVPEKVLHLCKGYSRDHRPDLNQAVLNLIVENKAGIPFHMEALDGNSSDKASFSRTVEAHVGSLALDFKLDYLMMDSAGYSAETIGLLGNSQKWISRVPEVIKDCKAAVHSEPESWQNLMPGYQCSPLPSFYGGVEQRWLLIFSQQAHERETATLKRKYARKSLAEHNQMEALCRQAFNCEKDARKAWDAFCKKCKTLEAELLGIRYRARHSSPGRPPKGAQPDKLEWHIEAQGACPLESYAHAARAKGRFVLATNDTGAGQLSDREVLQHYKDQSKVERGFRFLKDPQFVASTFFVKKPERVEALLFIMTLCLAVYAAIEYEVRKALRDKEDTVPNQIGKPIRNPTARWLFAIFAGIQVLYIDQQPPIILNLKPLHLKILKHLGPGFAQYYQSSP